MAALARRINRNVPFCAVGTDTALDGSNINCSMKVTGGLVGTAHNEAALTKFFLIAPKLARLAEEAEEMTGLSHNTPQHHHNLLTSVLASEEKTILKLTETIKSFANPLSINDKWSSK